MAGCVRYTLEIGKAVSDKHFKASDTEEPCLYPMLTPEKKSSPELFRKIYRSANNPDLQRKWTKIILKYDYNR